MSDNQKLIDTNILAYAYDRSEQQKHAVSNSLVADFWQTGDGVVTLQNLTEFFVVITKKVGKPLPVTVAKGIVSDFLRSDGWTVIDRDEEIFAKAMDFVESYGIHLWDALIAACNA